MRGQLEQFAKLCERLAGTSRKLEKRDLVAEYLRSLDSEDAALAALYLAGMPFAVTEGKNLNAGGALLSRVLAELTGAGRQQMHAAYRRHGDLGGAAYDLLHALPPASLEERRVPGTLALSDVAASFAEIAAASKPLLKQRVTFELLARATPLEAKYLVKIILGDMRTGIKESLVEEAIAAAYGSRIAQVRRATMLNGSLAEVVKLAADGRLEEASMKLFHPLGFMLASPVASVEEALRRFSSGEPGRGAVSPTVTPWTEAQLEDKYDGIRAQIHCGDPEQPGRVALFSRSREDMTVSFPEIVEAFAAFSQPVILDGEILAWSRASTETGGSGSGNDNAPSTTLKSDRALPFTALQPRLGRARVTADMRETAPVVFMAFDLLNAAGEIMLERPLEERRRALEEIVAREQPRTIVASRPLASSLSEQPQLQFEAPADQEAFARLVLAPAVQLKSVAQLEQAYADARARGNEGVMLKARHSPYQPGRRGLAWLKLKRELATLDVVVTAAEFGHGKRAGTLSDYTFAVRDGDTLKNVGKAYSGLTDAEIAMLTDFFLEHTIGDFGGMRTVEPRIVLEVAFNNVMRSDRHDSGFALRFPRIVRIRNDKPVSEIDSLERVEEVYRSQEAPPVVGAPAGADSP
jgi:DNA ligase 1